MAAVYRAVVQTVDDVFSAIENPDRTISIFRHGQQEPIERLQPSWKSSEHTAEERLMAELVFWVYEMNRGYEIQRAIFVLEN
jgi:hypothetical protein